MSNSVGSDARVGRTAPADESPAIGDAPKPNGRGSGLPSSPMPMVAIGGSRGKTTVACMLDAIVRSTGMSTGAWLSSGVFVDGDRLDGELGPWQRVMFATRHGELNLAIQEMTAATVTAVGLPPNAYPLAVITTICGNNNACLLTEDARTQRAAVHEILQSVRPDGLVVAGADDFDVAQAVESAQLPRALFALRRENPALLKHLAGGGIGGWVEDDWIVIGHNDQHQRVVRVDEIPATLDGVLAFQIQNALAAALASNALGIKAEAIARGLRLFTPDPRMQPAACNIISYNGARIVIDAPREIWSLRMLMRGIRNLPRRRTMVVSGIFPALPAEDVPEAARLLGTLGAIVVLHDDDVGSERLDLLRTGIAASPVPPLVVSLTDELRAIDHMLNRIGDSDVALVLASEPTRALEHLWPAPAISIEQPMVRSGRSGR